MEQSIRMSNLYCRDCMSPATEECNALYHRVWPSVLDHPTTPSTDGTATAQATAGIQAGTCQGSDFPAPQEASVTIVKDGDAQCRYCGLLADEEEQRHLIGCRFFRDSRGG